MTDQLRLAELLVARLCHDLSGPVATLTGTTELARADSGLVEEALDLAADAAGTLALRLRLYRAAWTADGTPCRTAEVQALAAGLPLRRNTELDLSGLDAATPFSAPARRLLLNALLLGVEGLSGGGLLSAHGSADAEVVVTIRGPGAAWPTGFAACLADEAAAWRAVVTSARSLQAPLTALIARQCGLRLSLLLSAGRTDLPPPLLLALGG